jgi:hypothetical protein
MGLKDRFRGAMEKVVEKMDEISASDTGTLTHEWPSDQPWAVLVESEWRPGARMHSDSGGADLTDIAADALMGIPYRFVLDVRRPGMGPYRLEQRVRIPSKVERSWTQGEVHVPAGAEVPLRATGPGPEDVEIDWEGYLALPGRKQAAEQARAEAQWDRMGAEFERTTKPEMVQKIRADNRFAALTAADAVLAGQLSRAEFDQSMEQSLRMGHLLPDDLAEAVAKLDG